MRWQLFTGPHPQRPSRATNRRRGDNPVPPDWFKPEEVDKYLVRDAQTNVDVHNRQENQ